MLTENDAFNSPLNPDHAHRIAAILSVQPDDSQPLTQFSPTQRAAYEWAIGWIHDFNLDRMPKPEFPDEVLCRLSDYHGTQMNEYLRQKKASAQGPTKEPTDSLAEWSQRALAGMKRMATDPEHRAAIGKRVS